MSLRMPAYLRGFSAVIAVAVVAACSSSSGSHAPVPGTQLQRGIADKLAQAGTTASWVDCPKDLPAAVGRTTRCVVSFGAKDAGTVILTTTEVNGDKVDWEVTGVELTKDQVTDRVASPTPGAAVKCDSGLDGRVGEWATCEIKKGGQTTKQIVEVASLKGLRADLKLIPLLSKQQVEQLLLAKMAAVSGWPPNAADCDGDLLGVKGTLMNCSVMTAGKSDPYVLAVTDTAGGTVDFSFAPRGIAKG